MFIILIDLEKFFLRSRGGDALQSYNSEKKLPEQMEENVSKYGWLCGGKQRKTRTKLSEVKRNRNV